MDINRMINESGNKDLEEELKDFKTFRVQIELKHKIAEREYVIALGAPTSQDRRNILQQECKILANKLAKIDDAIIKVEQRLGYNSSVTHHSKISGKNSANTKIADRAEKIISMLKVQITPSTECVEPNDAIIKAIFDNSTAEISVTEKHKSKKKAAVVSNLKLQGTAVDPDNPLDEHARAVLGVIVSEYDVGNRYTTVNIIHRALIGRPGQADAGFYPKKDQENAIINSVEKLMGTVVDFSDAADSLKKLQYTDKEGNELILRKDNLVSASILDAKVNGQSVKGVIFFKDSCPLFDIANAKNQVIRYTHALLNVPNQNNTPLVIALKKYVIRRICEIKLHSQLKPTITFDDIFSKCKVEGGNIRKKRQDARNVIIKFLEHLRISVHKRLSKV